MLFNKDSYNVNLIIKHPSLPVRSGGTTLRVTVKLSVVEVCFHQINGIESYGNKYGN
jgi:hypothetical protein